MNFYQGAVLHSLGWVLVLFDGWELHSHWLGLIGILLLCYSLWRIALIKEPEDEAFEEIERKQAEGWRKRQIEENISIEDAFNDWDHSHRPDQYDVQRQAFHAGWVAAMRRKHD